MTTYGSKAVSARMMCVPTKIKPEAWEESSATGKSKDKSYEDIERAR